MELVVATLSSLIIQSLLMQLLCMWGLVSHTVPHIENRSRWKSFTIFTD